MADIKVDPVILRIGHGCIPACGKSEFVGIRNVGMTVIADHHLMLVGKRCGPLRPTDLSTGGDSLDAERLRECEGVLNFVVTHTLTPKAIEAEKLQSDAGVVKLLADGFELVHRNRQTPLAKLLCSSAPGRLLLCARLPAAALTAARCSHARFGGV